jgi:hypothetical protein
VRLIGLIFLCSQILSCTLFFVLWLCWLIRSRRIGGQVASSPSAETVATGPRVLENAAPQRSVLRPRRLLPRSWRADAGDWTSSSSDAPDTAASNSDASCAPGSRAFIASQAPWSEQHDQCENTRPASPRVASVSARNDGWRNALGGRYDSNDEGSSLLQTVHHSKTLAA